MTPPKRPKEECPYCLRNHAKESAARRCLVEVREWKKKEHLAVDDKYFKQLQGQLIRYIANRWPKEGGE